MFQCSKRKKCLQWPILLVPLVVFMLSAPLFLLKKTQDFYVKTTSTTEVYSLSFASAKYVTRSMAQLGKMDEINKNMLMVNYMPGSGAEVLIFLLQKLQGFNSYRHVRLKGKPKMQQLEEEEFVSNVFDVMKSEAVPLSFDSQIHFINFTVFDKQSPTFLNLVREPAPKLQSREKKCKSCNIPYFCGQEPQCQSNTKWALQKAKQNIDKYYPVVGVLEEFNTTLEVLESKLPFFFKGAQKLYKKHILDKFLKKNLLKKPIKRMVGFAEEYELYDWIKRRLFQQLQILYGEHH